MDTSEEPFDGELTGTMPRPRGELRVVCEPAQFEMHMDMSSRKSLARCLVLPRRSMDPVEPLGLDDVAFFEMWHGIVPSLASLCGFSGLNFLQELVYTANK